MSKTPNKAHWAWTCVDCGMQGTVPEALPSVGDSENYATKRAERQHAKKRTLENCRSNSGIIRVDKIPDKLTRIRLDASKTAARYDEIVKLRMLILGLIDDCDLEEAHRRLEQWRKKAEQMSKGWGAKGDCA